MENVKSMIKSLHIPIFSWSPDLCLGKPALRSLLISATIGNALLVLKSSGKNYLSLWSCDHSSKSKVNFEDCRCVKKICMVDVIFFLCKEENLACPSFALKSLISVLLPKAVGIVRHVKPHFSKIVKQLFYVSPFFNLLDAIHLILEGAQNLIFYWLTQEDVIQFLLSSIGLFSPIAALSVESLGIISTEVLVV
uniref:Uncharacterized protein n=1 Tax=Nelumbo nucifera TaxID=4432 RepID=A0A822Y3K5_NELNU|nr:TPA_asm: hypothetical protein HUJ06_028628 [Nelumbo nucifera]